MSQLDDGVYDGIVIDAKEIDDQAIHIEVALSSGPRKGEIINVSARHLRHSWLELLGMPATITVAHGEPHIEFE